MTRVAIVGGGLSGLVTSILLARQQIPCILFEKKTYPFHRVCGEYVSNETLDFLRRNDLYPSAFNPPAITRFLLSDTDGSSFTRHLDLGGFGISRYAFDKHLYEIAKKSGVDLRTGEEVTTVVRSEKDFLVRTGSGEITANLVVGAFGKRSLLDFRMQRNFIRKRSPYAGIKYHIRCDNPADLISLHNFEGGYCGVSNVEDGITNLCYLTHSRYLKTYGNIARLEETILYRNPHLKKLFTDAEFIFDKPETITEVGFETKSPVENGLLMTGDAAAMIAPLCGNGMAMAIHSAKIASDVVTRYWPEITSNRDRLLHDYANEWNRQFAYRIWLGRQVQRLFGHRSLSKVAVNMILRSDTLAGYLIKKSHGKQF